MAGSQLPMAFRDKDDLEEFYGLYKLIHDRIDLLLNNSDNDSYDVVILMFRESYNPTIHRHFTRPVPLFERSVVSNSMWRKQHFFSILPSRFNFYINDELKLRIYSDNKIASLNLIV